MAYVGKKWGYYSREDIIEDIIQGNTVIAKEFKLHKSA
jgi:hypothetical protein